MNKHSSITRKTYSYKKRSRPSFETSSVFTIESFLTPIKRLKKNDSGGSNPLSNSERSIIYLQSKLGTKPHKIAIDLNRSHKVIKSFLDNASHKKNLAPNHNTKGRWGKGDTKLTERHKKMLLGWLQAGTMHSARQCWLRLTKIKSLSKISYHPVNNFLKTQGSFVRPKLKTQVSPANRAKRLQYCQDYGSFNFRKAIFTDESSFQLNANNIRAFKLKGQSPPKVTKYNPNHKIMVWGGISYYGKTSLTIIVGRLDQHKYVNVLSNHKREMKQIFNKRGLWYFQQDNAPCHKPARVKEYIQKNLGAELIPHPPQSPDMNPIELIWAFMKTKVESSRPRNKQQLLNSVQKAWRQVTLGLIRKCIDSLPKKMAKIVECNGEIL